jgi:hypothetical protein
VTLLAVPAAARPVGVSGWEAGGVGSCSPSDSESVSARSEVGGAQRKNLPTLQSGIPSQAKYRRITRKGLRLTIGQLLISGSTVL